MIAGFDPLMLQSSSRPLHELKMGQSIVPFEPPLRANVNASPALSFTTTRVDSLYETEPESWRWPEKT